ncbi:MAG: hypothetical protein ACYTGW_03340 [Planctomycetota bacterium]|jgi:hypothetical protein
MKRISLLPLLALLLLTPSCIFRVSAEDDPSLKMSGFGTAYAGYSGFDEWDGSLIQLGLLGGSGRAGEFFSLDIWPLGGVGVGLAGARVRVLPLEIGAGVLFYHPSLPSRSDTDVPEDLPDVDDEPGHDETRGAVQEEQEPKKEETGKEKTSDETKKDK